MSNRRCRGKDHTVPNPPRSPPLSHSPTIITNHHYLQEDLELPRPVRILSRVHMCRHEAAAYNSVVCLAKANQVGGLTACRRARYLCLPVSACVCLPAPVPVSLPVPAMRLYSFASTVNLLLLIHDEI